MENKQETKIHFNLALLMIRPHHLLICPSYFPSSAILFK